MAARGISRMAESLKERFASTWLLLSDTTNFLSRTSVFAAYEAELKSMRDSLATGARNPEVERKVRAELTDLRAALRVQGYDLSLGKLELSFQGYRNDAALVEGFRRMVLFIGRSDLWFLSGEDNHLVLHDRLDLAFRGKGLDVLQKHCLWYRWANGLLILSASDSETKDDFEALKTWASQPERRLLLLGKLRKLG